jgi:hypothetical protein
MRLFDSGEYRAAGVLETSQLSSFEVVQAFLCATPHDATFTRRGEEYDKWAGSFDKEVRLCGDQKCKRSQAR